MGSVCIPSCRCCVLMTVEHPVAILSAVFCVICSLLMFVSDAFGLMFMGSVMLSICSASWVLYSAWPGVKRAHVVLSGLRMILFVCVYVYMIGCLLLLCLCRCVLMLW